MEVTLKRDWFEEFTSPVFKAFGWNQNVKRHSDVDLHLFRLSEQQIKLLFDAVSGMKPTKETREFIGTIRRWRDIQAGKLPRATNARSAMDLIESYVAQHAAGFRLWKKIDGRWFGFFVASIWYEPEDKRGGHSPAMCCLRLSCSVFGAKQDISLSYESHECRGMTAQQLLAEGGYVIEDAEIRAAYDQAIEQHVYLCSRIGLQCHATGQSFGKEGRHDSMNEIRCTSDRRDNTINGRPGLVVVDTVSDDPDKPKRMRLDNQFVSNPSLSLLKTFFDGKAVQEDDYIDDEIDLSGDDKFLPIHPLVPTFDLIRHQRTAIHSLDLQEYEYDKTMGEKLILPEQQKTLLSLLVQSNGSEFKDIVASKSGGTVVLLAGRPGLGKTLSAEVFSECSSRPLYRVQCSQLGIDPDTIEHELSIVFRRARRWNAVVLLDEADLYIGERGADINRNAIVCVFLRVLESQDGVLFLTTNMPETVDDAIASRCIARIDVHHPTKSGLRAIWDVLLKSAGVKMALGDVEYFVEKFSTMGGRDVKAAIKLAMVNSGKSITRTQMEFVLGFHPNRGQWLNQECSSGKAETNSSPCCVEQ